MQEITVLWGVLIDQPDHMEQLITDKAEHIEKAKNWAQNNGFNRLRIAIIDDKKPDFIKTINI
jgi:hypothetical protein